MSLFKGLFVAGLALTFAGCKGAAEGGCTSDDDCPDGYVCGGGECFPAVQGGDNDGAGGDDDAGGDEGPGDSDTSDTDSTDVDVPPVDLDVVDTTPPTIEILEPAPMTMCSGRVVIRVQISDPSDIDEDSVEIIVANNPSLPFAEPIVRNGDVFSTVFDTRVLTQGALPYLDVVARDEVGNRGRKGHSFAIDNTPPVLAFSSPQLQRYDLSDDVCSWPFNPLGETALQHGDVVDPDAQFGLFFYARLRIEDFGNPVGVPELIAGIDDATTRLYLLTSAGIEQGLSLLESDASNRCTGISPDVLGEASQQYVISQTLVPTAPSGTADYTPLFGDFPCSASGSASEPPTDLCKSSPGAGITVWTSYTPAKLPNIYVVNAYDRNSLLSCAGGPFDVSYIDDGPACLTAEATDAVGNRAVAPPIAICIDKDGSGDCASFDADVAVLDCYNGCLAASFGNATDIDLYAEE